MEQGRRRTRDRARALSQGGWVMGKSFPSFLFVLSSHRLAQQLAIPLEIVPNIPPIAGTKDATTKRDL